MSVHRIRIQGDRDGSPVGVDLVLPSGTPVGELVPAVLHLIDDRPPGAELVRGWRLDRPTGGALMESLSLRDNGVHDGELLILAAEHAPPLGLIHREPCAEVAATRPAVHPGGSSLPGVVCVLAALVAAAALAWSGADGQSTVRLIISAIGACVAVTVALAVGHSTPLGVAAVTLTAATGFLAVPSGPAAPNVFLASAAAVATALLVVRLTGRTTPTLVALATLSALMAVATVVTLPVAAVGPLLASGSVVLLALAPRIAVAIGGLGPDHWTGDVVAPAVTGHATLTGLVAGCAAGAASGAALTAWAGVRYGVAPHGAVAFAALMALVLLLRARSHQEWSRQIALVAAGLVSATSALMTTVVTWPHHAGLVGGGLVALALLAGRGPQLGPAAARTADRLEYAALAAVVPVALWVGGAYAFVSAGHLRWG